MIWTHALLVGVLFAAGTYLLLQRSLTRIVLGLGLLGHGANMLLVAAGGLPGTAPIVGEDPAQVADPLPQALALTAIVITFGLTVLILALAHRSWQVTGDDEVPDDLEDRRVAREGGDEEVA